MLSQLTEEIFMHIKMKSPVVIIHNNDTGEWLWSVALQSDLDLWLDSFYVKEDAINYCIINNLPYTFYNK